MPIAHINGHDMYYEVHGDGSPAVYIGGWGYLLPWSTSLLGAGDDRPVFNGDH